ncbi:MAG: hypothetical protein RL607_1785 [Bacteroidota bacterium]|jgi:hypothetical protein
MRILYLHFHRFISLYSFGMLLVFISVIWGCSPMRNQSFATQTLLWKFTTLAHWQDDSQQTEWKKNYMLDSQGYLKLFTHPNTAERSKIRTVESFALGTYTWKIFVPEFGKGDNTSIGAFLYDDDAHELDFEIGNGTQALRNTMHAKNDELLVFMTSQGTPVCSKTVKIKNNAWYEFSLTIQKNRKNKWNALWKINQKNYFKVELQYQKNTNFHIYCSVENLPFMGDHLPKVMNYALFDYVKFEPQFE